MNTIEQFWPYCFERLQTALTSHQFNTWIVNIHYACHEDTLTLYAPNHFALNFIQRYRQQIEAYASDFRPDTPIHIVLDVVSNAAPDCVLHSMKEHVKPQTPPPPPPASAPSHTATPSPSTATPRNIGSSHESTRLNPAFTFETLVSGKSNQLAWAAATQIATNPGDPTYNPFFVYGGVGLGKTHLIQAIGNHIYQKNPTARIRYIHAERYVSDIMKAYQHKAFDDFKRYYHSLDLLLIDDIQFFAGKNRTMEEFFYAFNALQEGGRQVVMTCDTIPKDISGMDARLVSRFSSGLTVEIQPPELEMRVAILEKKAEADHLKLDRAIAFFIAQNVRSNVRELEGALKRVVAFSRFSNQSISMDLVKEALKDILAAGNRQISIETIQKTVADYYKLKLTDMHSKKRSRDIARPRQIAMALAKELTSQSLPSIGAAFGGRDHTTVLHACKIITDLRSREPQIGHDFSVLLQMLRN